MKRTRKTLVLVSATLLLGSIALTGCSSSTAGSGKRSANISNYCTPGATLASCMIRDTYRNTVNLFPW